MAKTKKKSVKKTTKKVKKTQPKPKNIEGVVKVHVVKSRRKTRPVYDIMIRKKLLGHAPQEYHFHLKSGEKLGSLYELIDALTDMSEDVFQHHVNEMRNDFSTWIHDVFEDKELADDIRRFRTRMETQSALMQRVIKELRRAAHI